MSLGRAHPDRLGGGATPGDGRADAAVEVVTVEVVTVQPDESLTVSLSGHLRDLARRVLEAEGVRGPAELSLGFVSEDEMTGLNREWMGHDGPTDVLAWPLDGLAPDEVTAGLPGVPVLLGDVAVCPAVAGRQAAAAGHDLADELALLVVHGVLHVLGHDHDGPAAEAAMQARETAHLVRFHDAGWSRRPG